MKSIIHRNGNVAILTKSLSLSAPKVITKKTHGDDNLHHLQMDLVQISLDLFPYGYWQYVNICLDNG